MTGAELSTTLASAPAPGVSAPGHLMAAEIAEQPQVWRRLLTGEGAEQVATAAERVRHAAPRFVVFVARGTSDHAALYGKYLVEIVHQLPAGLASPSTMTAYGARPDLRGVLLVAVSQSGGSPDLVRSTEVAREQGALTLAVTNNPDSDLAAAAEVHLDVRAGAERAVAATKSYTAQLLALHQVLALAGGGDPAAAAALPELGESVLAQEPLVADIAARYRFASRLVTTARGYSYPTAREAALKLMETSYLSAQAFSGADLLHGPLAMIDAHVPVITVLAAGRGGAAMASVLPRLVEARADVCTIGTEEAVAASTTGIVLPGGVPEQLSPLLEVLPLQQLALHLAVARGEDPDAPRGLRKVTETT